jgi:dephospho-CoA kinase
MLNIAITGGIASGKTMASNYLKSLGYTVVDADEMAREITGPGGKAIPYIRDHFGDNYILEDGSLNRAAMRDLVFKNPAKLSLLEAGTTRVVLQDIEMIKKERERAGDEIVFYDIPLLFEKNEQDNYDAVWVVTADRNIRIARVMERDSIDEKMADLIMDAQEDEDKKIEAADYVIYNNGSLGELERSLDDALAHFTEDSE